MKEQKPREFWIDEQYVGRSAVTELKIYNAFDKAIPKSRQVHVIEKSAYDEAIKLLRLCEEALAKIQHSPKSAEARANETLATIRDSGLLGDK